MMFQSVRQAAVKVPVRNTSKLMLLRIKNTNGPQLMPAWLFTAREEPTRHRDSNVGVTELHERSRSGRR